jgi:hypothetical protein
MTQSLGYSPGDVACGGSYVWIAEPATARVRVYDPTTMVEQGGSYPMDISSKVSTPHGLAYIASGPASGLWVSGRCAHGQYNNDTLFRFSPPSTTPLDSLPAVGPNSPSKTSLATGLAYDTGESRLWTLLKYDGVGPPDENKVMGYESRFFASGGDGSTPPQGQGDLSKHFMGINFRRTVAAINAYCGNNASRELSDGASGDHFATLLENAIEMVNVTPPTKDIDLFFEDLPDTVRQNDAFDIPMLLRRLYPSDPPPATDFKLYLIINMASKRDTTVIIEATFPNEAWTISGSLLFMMPYDPLNPDQYPTGEWSVLGYTKIDGHSEWNEKAEFTFMVDGLIEFPSSMMGSDIPRFSVELVWDEAIDRSDGIPPYNIRPLWELEDYRPFNDIVPYLATTHAMHFR